MKRMKDKILKAINDAGAFIAHYECTRVSLTSHRYIIKAYRENNSLIDIDRVVIDNDHAVFLDEVKKTAQLNVPANMLDNDADMNYLIRVGKYLNISEIARAIGSHVHTLRNVMRGITYPNGTPYRVADMDQRRKLSRVITELIGDNRESDLAFLKRTRRYLNMKQISRDSKISVSIMCHVLNGNTYPSGTLIKLPPTRTASMSAVIKNIKTR